jgi:hypothetical protein
VSTPRWRSPPRTLSSLSLSWSNTSGRPEMTKNAARQRSALRREQQSP